MKVLLIHARYQQRAGEDNVFEAERRLLIDAGHRVVEYVRDNKEISQFSMTGRIRLAAGTVWSQRAHEEISQLIAAEKPDIAHCTNLFPIISPSAYYACRKGRVPVVHTLHNYRMLCPAGTLARDGRTCHDCLDKSLLNSIRYACYRDSPRLTAVVASFVGIHRKLGTFRNAVDRFIVLTDFARRLYAQHGFPEERIVVKPNFLSEEPEPRSAPGDFALFVGRLAREKGLHTLLKAWSRLPEPIPLRIVGDGPDEPLLRELARSLGLAQVEFLGRLPRDRTLEMMKASRFLVFPSEWYEGFPLTILEAFACGVPVLASDIGAMSELVRDHQNGRHFRPADPNDLSKVVSDAWAAPDRTEALGRAARVDFETRYTTEISYRTLISTYEAAIAEAENAEGRQ